MSGPRRIPVDWNFCGNASTLTVRLLPEERGGLTVGDPVVLVGDAVEPREAVVTALSADGRDVVVQLTGARRMVSADLARFTAAGFGTVHGARRCCRRSRRRRGGDRDRRGRRPAGGHRGRDSSRRRRPAGAVAAEAGAGRRGGVNAGAGRRVPACAATVAGLASKTGHGGARRS